VLLEARQAVLLEARQAELKFELHFFATEKKN
jgi:hypothetical protein